MEFHPLHTRWQLWAHLPLETSWSMESYTPIMTITHAEELIALTQALPDKLVSCCMLFFMRESVHPTWEDPQNCDGGCFSYKVTNKSVPETWKELWGILAGEILEMTADITGMSISPKKGFCVLKIWMKNTKHQDPTEIVASLLKPQGCIFKRHKE